MLRKGLKVALAAAAVPVALLVALQAYVSAANVGLPPTKEDPAASLVFRQGEDHPVTGTMKQAANELGGVAAPEFGVVDTGARYATLASLTDKKPLVLFFVELQCPCCKGAKPFVDRIADTYGDVCNVVGVINADHDLAVAWSNAVVPKFRVLCDPKMDIIHAYKAQRGVYTTLISPGGRIVKAYPGYSKEMLRDIGAKIAKLARIEKRSMAVSDAPKTLTSGCLFPGTQVPVDQL